jgi:hypothetical protein
MDRSKKTGHRIMPTFQDQPENAVHKPEAYASYLQPAVFLVVLKYIGFCGLAKKIEVIRPKDSLLARSFIFQHIGAFFKGR